MNEPLLFKISVPFVTFSSNTAVSVSPTSASVSFARTPDAAGMTNSVSNSVLKLSTAAIGTWLFGLCTGIVTVTGAELSVSSLAI